MTTLGTLLSDLTELHPAEAGLVITRVTDDSRQVEPGTLFVAVRGLTVDGHDFCAAAADRGATAIVAERALHLAVPCVVVEDSTRALALCAARLCGEPARRLRLIGVTGTNGKTTTTYLIEAILASAGLKPGVVGTVGYRYAGLVEKAPFTTPTPLLLHQLLGRMVEAGCTDAVMEVSSHALQLGRVHGLDFSVAAFTHLTQDHLDLHGSMEAYLQAKLLLFRRHMRPGGTAVVHLDGKGASRVLEALSDRPDVRILRCSAVDGERDAEVGLHGIRHSIDGLTGTLRLGTREVELRSRLLGAYNAENLVVAAGCGHAAGLSDEDIVRGIAEQTGVPGRLERVDGGRDFAVLVDYAHTPDALERAIGVLRALCKGRLVVVFGCGGDRDRGKRPLMGAAVARGADLAVVTSDNPRTEEPGSIISMILDGMQNGILPNVKDLNVERGYLVQPDRRLAIEAAVRAARPNDIVLIAGKGHEDYQILGRERIHFDDREQARAALELR